MATFTEIRDRVQELVKKEGWAHTPQSTAGFVPTMLRELAITYFMRREIGDDANFVAHQLNFLAKNGYVGERE